MILKIIQEKWEDWSETEARNQAQFKKTIIKTLVLSGDKFLITKHKEKRICELGHFSSFLTNDIRKNIDASVNPMVNLIRTDDTLVVFNKAYLMNNDGTTVEKY